MFKCFKKKSTKNEEKVKSKPKTYCSCCKCNQTEKIGDHRKSLDEDNSATSTSQNVIRELDNDKHITNEDIQKKSQPEISEDCIKECGNVFFRFQETITKVTKSVSDECPVNLTFCKPASLNLSKDCDNDCLLKNNNKEKNRISEEYTTELTDYKNKNSEQKRVSKENLEDLLKCHPVPLCKDCPAKKKNKEERRISDEYFEEQKENNPDYPKRKKNREEKRVNEKYLNHRDCKPILLCRDCPAKKKSNEERRISEEYYEEQKESSPDYPKRKKNIEEKKVSQKYLEEPIDCEPILLCKDCPAKKKNQEERKISEEYSEEQNESSPDYPKRKKNIEEKRVNEKYLEGQKDCKPILLCRDCPGKKKNKEERRISEEYSEELTDFKPILCRDCSAITKNKEEKRINQVYSMKETTCKPLLLCKDCLAKRENKKEIKASLRHSEELIGCTPVPLGLAKLQNKEETKATMEFSEERTNYKPVLLCEDCPAKMKNKEERKDSPVKLKNCKPRLSKDCPSRNKQKDKMKKKDKKPSGSRSPTKQTKPRSDSVESPKCCQCFSSSKLSSNEGSLKKASCKTCNKDFKEKNKIQDSSSKSKSKNKCCYIQSKKIIEHYINKKDSTTDCECGYKRDHKGQNKFFGRNKDNNKNILVPCEDPSNASIPTILKYFRCKSRLCPKPSIDLKSSSLYCPSSQESNIVLKVRENKSCNKCPSMKDCCTDCEGIKCCPSSTKAVNVCVGRSSANARLPSRRSKSTNYPNYQKPKKQEKIKKNQSNIQCKCDSGIRPWENSESSKPPFSVYNPSPLLNTMRCN